MMFHRPNIIATVLTLSVGCGRESGGPDPTAMMVGTWKITATIDEDGTRVPAETTYALLEYNYSDGFILYPDRRTGNSMWYGGVNDAAGERFQWILVDEAWTITLTRSDGSKEDFTFQVSDLTDSRMDLQTPKGFRYQLEKQ